MPALSPAAPMRPPALDGRCAGGAVLAGRPAPGVRAGTVDHRTRGHRQLNLLDRQALRRVAGLSTELEDVTEVEYRALRLERVVLVGVWTEGTLASAENSLRELSRLAETAGSVVLDGLIQRARAARPGDLHRLGQGGRARRRGRRDRRGHGDLRR